MLVFEWSGSVEISMVADKPFQDWRKDDSIVAAVNCRHQI